jgi:hypothetical protein
MSKLKSTAAALLLLASIPAQAADRVATCEGDLVSGHGGLIILPKGKGECLLTGFAGDPSVESAVRYQKVLAVCVIAKKWATPHHCKVSGLAVSCDSEEAKNGEWCLEFKTIDKVSK